MDLTLQVDGTEHDSSDRVADRWVVPWVHWLPGFLDARNLDEPDERIAQVNEKPEWVVAQHHPCHGNAAGEARLCCLPFLVGGLAARPQGLPFIGIWLAHVSNDAVAPAIDQLMLNVPVMFSSRLRKVTVCSPGPSASRLGVIM